MNRFKFKAKSFLCLILIGFLTVSVDNGWSASHLFKFATASAETLTDSLKDSTKNTTLKYDNKIQAERTERYIVEVSGKEKFPDDYYSYIEELPEQDTQDCVDYLNEKLSDSDSEVDSFTHGMEIGVYNEVNEKVTDLDSLKVRVYMESVEGLSDYTLYNFYDGEAKKVDFTTGEDSEHSGLTSYVEFSTDTLGTFLFVTESKITSENAKKDSQKDFSEDTQEVSRDSSESSEQISENTPNVTSSTEADMYFSSLKLSIFKGATKQDDGSYKWSPAGNESNHAFGVRLSYSVSGSGTADVGQVRAVLPKTVFADTDGNTANTYEMSIPTKAEADDYIAGVNTDIDDDVNFAYYEEDDRIIIYNFREITEGESGYIEMSYKTSKTIINYKADSTYTVTCTGTVSDGNGNTSVKAATPINITFGQLFKVGATTIDYPTKYNTWWYWSKQIEPDNYNDYIYLKVYVHSNIATTMLYQTDLKATVTGATQEMTDAMQVIGYGFVDGDFQKEGTKKNCSREARTDSIMIAINKKAINNADTWKAAINAEYTFTPSDGSTPVTNTLKTTWSWTHPVFKIPQGTLGGFVRADGGYRNNSGKKTSDVFQHTTHVAGSMSFTASDYSRYDLEKFNGYGDETISLTEFDGFDYASWIGGKTYAMTYDTDNYASDKTDVDGYGKRNVTFELKNTGVYLFDPSKADKSIKTGMLTSDDFSYYRIDYSTAFSDPKYNESELEFDSTSATYQDGETLYFYGKFGKSSKEVLFATHNLKTKAVWYDSDYVSSVNDRVILFKDSADLVSYTVKTSNKHLYSEIFTVPYVKLKNSKTVMDFVKNKEQIAIENCNISNIYSENADGNLVLEATNEDSDCDYARTMKRSSTLSKYVSAVSNNTKKKYYTFSWLVSAEETATTGDGLAQTVNQESGIFFDLMPKGATLDKSSILVRNGTNEALNKSEYTVKTYDNYKNSGRTLLVVKINTSGPRFSMNYDTVYSWDSINDYGESVYNPVAYKTGNEDIANGLADTGGTIKDAKLLSGLDEVADDGVSTGNAKKYIYTQTWYNFLALTSASSGLKVKVKGPSDKDYTSSTATGVNKSYSYRLRYQNSINTTSKNLIFFDSLENYNRDNKTTDGNDSQWRGVLQSIDTTQAEEKGIKPVVYISTVENLNIEDNHNIKDSSVWTKVTEDTDLSTAKAVAVDLRKKEDGKDFELGEKESVSIYLYMKTPETAPDLGENVLPYTYNNGYISSTLVDSVTCDEEDFFVHQDYTSASLSVTGSFGLRKVSSESSSTKIGGVTFHLSGTSKYGTVYDQDMITSTNGEIAFDDIEMGSYTLQETKTSNDWILDSEVHSVVVDGQGNVLIDNENYTDKFISVENTPRIHANTSFKSVDATYTSKTIEGTQFKLTGTSDYGTNINQFGTSNSNGTVSFRNLEKGTYELVETKATDGYSLNQNVYQLTVDSDGNYSIALKTPSDVTKIDVQKSGKTYLIGNEPVKDVTFYEASSWDNSMLPGGKFILTGTSDYGTVVEMEATSDSNGQVKFEGLEKGVYTLKQKEAPDGYTLNENTYTVQVNPVLEGGQGTTDFTIEGLITNDKILGGKALIFYDSPVTDTITITKDWDDGEEDRQESELNIILTTDKPSQYYASHSITFNANGGSFGTSASNNEVLYGVSKLGVIQTTISGTVLLPTKTGYKFDYWDKSSTAKSYWTTNKDGTGDKYYSVADDVYHVVDANGNIPTLKSDLVLYAQYQKMDATLKSGSDFNKLIPATVTSIVFTDEEAPDGVTLTDASAAGDGSVVAWIDPDDETVWKVSSQSDGVKMVLKNASYMFSGRTSLTSISFDGYVDSSSCKTFWSMFMNCNQLESIDFTGIDTSSATDMGQMFMSCPNLKSLDLSMFDTSKVTRMSYMFKYCGVTSLDLSNFNTENVTSMNNMFHECKSLTTLNISNFNTSKVTNMDSMFYWCPSLTSLDVSSFDTSNVTNMHNMFGNEYYTNSNLTSLDLSNFDTSKVTDMGNMFDCQTSLKSIKLSSSFNTSKVTNMSCMFRKNRLLESLDLSHFDTSNVTNMSSMFLREYGKDDTSLDFLDFSNFDTSNVTDMNTMFYGVNVDSLDLSSFNTSKVKDMHHMFCYCTAKSIDVSNFDTSNVTDMKGMFLNTRNLTSLDLSNFNTGKVTTMWFMFYFCDNLQTLDISNFNTANVTDMQSMFRSCFRLKNIYVKSDWDTSSVTTSTQMFDGSSNLPGYDSTAVDASKAKLLSNGGYFTKKSS